LVAAQPAAWPVLKNLLEELADLVPVHAVSEAMQVLEQGAMAGFRCGPLIAHTFPLPAPLDAVLALQPPSKSRR
jgi:hypothetical protein